MEDEDVLPVDDDEIAEAIERIQLGTAELKDILLLANASSERDMNIAPTAVTVAVAAGYTTDSDFTNGGADQFVWNNGADTAREIGQSWRNVGACENGDLLIRLANTFEAYRDSIGSEPTGTEPIGTQHFLEYRKLCKGPFFGIPEPMEELAEALVEWSIEHASEFIAHPKR